MSLAERINEMIRHIYQWKTLALVSGIERELKHSVFYRRGEKHEFEKIGVDFER